MQDAILDLDALLMEYPEYEGFVSNAFPTLKAGSRSYEAVSISSWIWTKQTQGRVQVVLMHSRDDELLSYAQPVIALKRLSALSESIAPKHRVHIPEPTSHTCHHLAYWYRGQTQKESVAARFRCETIRVSTAIQVDWDTLSVCTLDSTRVETDT